MNPVLPIIIILLCAIVEAVVFFFVKRPKQEELSYKVNMDTKRS